MNLRIILVYLLVLSLGTASRPVAAEPLPHFRRVTNGVSIGGPPTEAGLGRLYKMHFSTVVDLGEPGLQSREEQQQIERLGYQYVSIPFHYLNVPIGNRAPTPEEVQRVVQTFDVLPEHTADWMPAVYVHGGGDDVSLAACMVGMWRIKHERWPFKKALDEMKSLGFKDKNGELTNTVKQFAEQYR